MKLDVLYTPSGRAGEYANHGYAVNLYDGCSHKCAYCYVPQVLHRTRELFHFKVEPRNNILQRLEKDLSKVGILDEPIFLCFTCDPYPANTDATTTREALKLIKASGNNVRILTKGNNAYSDFDLLDNNDEFGVTLTFDNMFDSREWEPGVHSPYSRTEALRLANQLGIKTWASFEPVIEPEQTLRLAKCISHYCDLMKFGKLNHANRLPESYKDLVWHIDWKKFALDVIALMQEIGYTNYVLKEDLKAYLAD
jgi:DNA repair photolyase